MPTFIFTQPEYNQMCFELPDGRFSVGRSRRNQIIIDDTSVSKEHAELLIYGSEVIVRECGSQNGTYVGGARLELVPKVRIFAMSNGEW